MRKAGHVEESPVLLRGRHYAGYAVAGVIFLTNCIWTWNFEQLISVMSPLGVVLTICHLVWRHCLFVEECQHVQRLCSGNYLTLYKRTLSFNTASSIIAVLNFGLAMSSKVLWEKTYQELGIAPYCLSFCFWFILSCIMQTECCPTWEAHTMANMKGTDYGSGMAHQYFHGYLKLILPTYGDNTRGILDRISYFMECENLVEENFPVKKLVILIPSSGYSFPTLCSEPSQSGEDPDIELIQPDKFKERLPDHTRDRAGTKGRVYRGTPYRIRVRDDGKVFFLYTLAEGATPMLTFFEACSAGSSEAANLREHRVDIVSNFYHALQNLIISDKQIRHLVDLIYYDDEEITKADVISLLKNHLLNAGSRQAA